MRANWVFVFAGRQHLAAREYQPVAWDGRGSWAQARAAAERSSRSTRSIARIDASSRRYRGKHVVEPGETLSGVAVRYRYADCRTGEGQPRQPPYHVYAGQVLVGPGDSMPAQPCRLCQARRRTLSS